MCISAKVIGRNIRAARLRAKVTQEEAAQWLDISAIHYGRLERGIHIPSLSILTKTAIVFHSSLEELLFGSTDYLYGSCFKDKAYTLTAIDLLSAGCSSKSQSLMLDICQVIARHDKCP